MTRIVDDVYFNSMTHKILHELQMSMELANCRLVVEVKRQ